MITFGAGVSITKEDMQVLDIVVATLPESS